MRIQAVEVPLGLLLPTQEEVLDVRVNYFMDLYRQGADITPIPVVPYYPDKDTHSFILPDGHHRAYAVHALGASTIAAQVYNDDRHIRAIDTRHGGHLGRMNSYWDVLIAYQQEWAPRMAELNIRAIGDLTLIDTSRLIATQLSTSG